MTVSHYSSWGKSVKRNTLGSFLMCSVFSVGTDLLAMSNKILK